MKPVPLKIIMDAVVYVTEVTEEEIARQEGLRKIPRIHRARIMFCYLARKAGQRRMDVAAYIGRNSTVILNHFRLAEHTLERGKPYVVGGHPHKEKPRGFSYPPEDCKEFYLNTEKVIKRIEKKYGRFV